MSDPVKEKLQQNFSHVTRKKDGTYEVRVSYFYRHGMTPGTVAARVKAVFPNMVFVEGEDHWAPWPRDSYMRVRFRVPSETSPKMRE